MSLSLDIGTFSVDFLAEIGLDISVVGFFYLFSYKGKKWKYPVIFFMVLITPFYLHLIKIPTLWSLLSWSLLIPFGLLIFVRNIQATAYSSVLNPLPKQSAIKHRKKEADKITLSERIKAIERFNFAILTVIIIVAITSGMQNFPAIAQIPLFWIILFITLGLLMYSRFANKKSIENNLIVNIRIFLVSTYLLMGLSFTSFYFYLTGILHISMISSLTYACISVMIVFAVNSYVLNLTKKAIQESEKKTKILKRFAGILKKGKLLNLAFILALSDFPIIVGFMINENTDIMIIWTIGFMFFVAAWLQSTIREDLLLQLEAGLTDRGKIEAKFKKLV